MLCNTESNKQQTRTTVNIPFLKQNNINIIFKNLNQKQFN